MDYDMPVMTKRVKCYLYSVGIWSNEGMKYLELNDGSQEQEQEQDNVPFFRVYASKGSETETTFFLDGVITIGRVQNGLRLLDGKNKEDRSKGFSSLEKKRLSSDTETGGATTLACAKARTCCYTITVREGDAKTFIRLRGATTRSREADPTLIIT
ncbi:uncharacterized protein LOC113329068 isoform X2 [Papaver somniferum]|uniref:uncharacterized protein LOC113329068 isoform X2 n=1 Tax=Papaver somniferum TaxID=3469 RepID=UPI000E6FAC67|nr:uncharacterized protein LOC113329068 isoform X2 [Papaver somniferum]